MKRARKLTQAVSSHIPKHFHKRSLPYRWSAAVAGFGMLLRDSKYKGDASYHDMARLAKEAKGLDPHGYRSELIRLIEKAELLDTRNVTERD